MDENSSGRHLLSFGYGEAADCLRLRLNDDKYADQPWKTTVAVRRPVDIEEALPDVNAIRFTKDEPLQDPESAISQATHVLICIPPGPKSDFVLDHHRQDFLRWGRQIEWIGYLSSTGVYGDRGGEWVTEESTPRPRTDRAIRRYRAEQDWFRLGEDIDVPVMAFRLAGLYGKGRNAFFGLRKKQARPAHQEGQFFSRVHYEDVAQVLEASISKPNRGSIYNVCDDHPSGQEDPIRYAAELLGMPDLPKFNVEKAEVTEMSRSFYSENRRVRNDRIKTELGVKLLYPSYKEGLKKIFEDMKKQSN